MDEVLINILENIEIPDGVSYKAYRQGSIPEEMEYPDTFFTFWNNNTVEHSAYDNNTTIEQYDFDVYVYSTDIDLCINLLSKARKMLKDNGWIIDTISFDAYSDEITHVGKGMRVLFLKQV